MKKVTTIEEYNNDGKMIKKTVIEEDGNGGTTYVPWVIEPMPTYPTIAPWTPTWYCTTEARALEHH